MEKSNAVAFGTVNMKAQVLSDVSRPDGSGGQWVPSFAAGEPGRVGENAPSFLNLGQGVPASGGEMLGVGQTRPGGPNGQGTGAKGPTPKRATVLD